MTGNSCSGSYSNVLIAALLRGYASIKPISKDGLKTLPILMIITNASDMEFAYHWLLTWNSYTTGIWTKAAKKR